MGFWSKLFGNEMDTTVSDYQARAATGGPFRMVVEDVFTITGRGTVATGRVEAGSVNVGDVVSVTTGTRVLRSKVGGLEAFRKRLTTAGPGDNIGLILDGVGRDDVERGSVLASLDPGLPQ